MPGGCEEGVAVARAQSDLIQEPSNSIAGRKVRKAVLAELKANGLPNLVLYNQ